MIEEQARPETVDGGMPPMPARPRADPRVPIALAALTLVLGLLGGLFWRVLFLGESFGDRDLAEYYHSAKSLVAPLSMASQGIPVWNPFFSSGQPFAANPEHEVFHPMTSLFFLLPFELAFRLQVIVPLLAGFASMYFLLRTLRRSRSASLFGGLTWGFGGYLLSTTNLLPILYAAAILPLPLAFAVRLIRAPSALDVVWLAICVGLQCLAGEPSTLVAMLPLLTAAIAFAWRRDARRGLLAVMLGLVMSVGIGAVTLLPGAHHASKTDRAAGLDPAQTGQWSMPAVRAFELLSPHVLGHVRSRDERLHWGAELYPLRDGPYFHSLYPGLAVALLAFAIGRRRLRALLPWVVVAGFGYLCALGTNFPLWRLLRHLPVLSSLRFPEKYALLFAVPIVILAAHGYDAVILGRRSARRGLAWVLLGLLVVALIGAAGMALVASRWPAEIALRAATRDLLRVAVVAAGLAAVLWLFRRRGRTARALAVCAVLTVDLVTAGREIMVTQPIAELASPPAFLLPLIQRSPDAPVFHAAAWETSLNRVRDLGTPPRTAQWGLASTLELDFDYTFLRWTNEGTNAFWRAVRGDSSLAKPLLERRGVGAIIQFRQGARWQGDFVVGPEGTSPIEVKSLKNAQPLVFAAARVETVRGTDGWLAAVRRLRLEARDSVCIDDDRFTGFSTPPAPADVKILWRRPARIAMQVDGKGPHPSFVAFNQTWDEGWQLTIDDKPATLLRTDISLSGFVVPPGQHKVEIAYVDHWIHAGAAMTVSTMLCCLGLVLWTRRRPRGAPEAP